MTNSQKTELTRFNAAKEIALKIETGFRRSTFDPNNFYIGANLKGLGAVVIWLEKNAKNVHCVRDGRLSLDGDVWHFRKVHVYTILSA